MKIVLITQDEPFFLAENLKYLFNNLPAFANVVGCVVNDVSPFGKKESFLKKSYKTFKIFGLSFFIYYAFKFLYVKTASRTSVKKILVQNNVRIIKLQKQINHKDSVKKIKKLKPDLLISILGNQIFKKQIYNLAPKGCINLHTALLPKYRGLMPTFWVLLNEEKFTGVSVFYVNEGIDSGPIIIQEKIKIGNMSQLDLIKRTKKIGMKCIIKSIKKINNGKIQLIKNDASNSTYFSFPTKADVIEFKRKGKKFF